MDDWKDGHTSLNRGELRPITYTTEDRDLQGTVSAQPHTDGRTVGPDSNVGGVETSVGLTLFAGLDVLGFRC